MRIGLIVDHPRRDLAGLVLVAREIVRNGAEAVLIPMYQQGIEAPILDLSVLIVNYARENNRALLEGYREIGLPVAVLDTEGGVLSDDGPDSPLHWARTLQSTGLSSLVDGCFCWGDRVRDVFAAHGGFRFGTVVTTGCPRFDLAHPRWRLALRPASSGYVLVNCNFPLVSPAHTASAERELEVFFRLGMTREYAQALFAETQRAFAGFLDLIDRLSARHANRRFLLRPHPFERPDPYETRFAGRPNVIVSAKGDVFTALAGADCMLHLNCGTAVEAAMMGKLAVQLEFLNTDVLRRHTPMPRRISLIAESEGAVHAVLDDPASAAARHDVQSRLDAEVRPYFGPLDGAAASRVAIAALGIARTEGGRAIRSSAASVSNGVLRPNAGQRLQGLAGAMLGPACAGALRAAITPARRAKRFSVATLNSLLDVFDRCAGGPAIAARGVAARDPRTGFAMESVIIKRSD